MKRIPILAPGLQAIGLPAIGSRAVGLLPVGALLAALGAFAVPADARELSLAYFMGSKHPMNRAVFTPFADKLERLSGGRLTVKQFPGGALNSSPPRQYSILLDGVADVVFALPGYTGDLFPKTNLLSYPGVCGTAISCTEALQRARPELEKEYRAKVLAIWSNVPPSLLTRDKPVRRLEDLKGMKIRVTSRLDVPFIEALGASAVMQPVTAVHRNLANGVIDGIAIGASGIPAFKLHEPANYLTTWLPISGAPFVLLMNGEVYDSLSAEEKGWVDAAADSTLSAGGGAAYERAGARGIRMSREAGVEIIELPDEEKRRFEEAIAPAYEAALSRSAGDMTVGEVIGRFKGE